MLTLKEHYKDVLQGKNESELKVYSAEVRLEMNQLKYDIESLNSADFKRLERSKLSKINKYRLYLRETCRAIEKTGCIIKPPEEDIIASIFQENIPYIEKINYSIGGYFGGFDVYEVRFENGQVEVNKEPIDYRGVQLNGNSFMEYYEDNEKEKISKKEFLNTVKRLRMGEWRNNYLSDDYGITITDGASWSVEVHYSNELNKFECGGINAYPYNFYEFNRLIEKAFEAYHKKL